MDQVGPYESDHGKILVLRDGKDPALFAEGFRAIFGMAWHDGALYVSHMPYLSVLRDTDGDGKADDAQGPLQGPGDHRQPRPERPHRLRDPVRDRRPALHLDRRQGRPQGDRSRRQDGAGRRRRDPPLPPGWDRDRGDLDRDPEPPRAQPRREATTSSPTTTPTTATAGGPGSRTTSTEPISATPTTTTTILPVASSTGWPSTAADPPAAGSSTRKTPGPRSTAAAPSGPSGASARSPASASSPTEPPSRSATSSSWPRSATPASSAPSTSPCPMTAKPSTSPTGAWASWGSKTEKVGRVYAISYKGPEIATQAPRQGFRPAGGPVQAARSPFLITRGCGPRRRSSRPASRRSNRDRSKLLLDERDRRRSLGRHLVWIVDGDRRAGRRTLGGMLARRR